jgi:hypothetical protein
MSRREFIAALGARWHGCSRRAQQVTVPGIGYLSGNLPESNARAMLRQSGGIQGKDNILTDDPVLFLVPACARSILARRRAPLLSSV